MSRAYQHLCADERDQLAMLRSQGLSLRAIARRLGRDPGTVSRELARNAAPIYRGAYMPHRAQARAAARWCHVGHRPRLRTAWARWYVARQLVRGWSPQLIAGRLA